jgi:uncharacterized protein with von Willebrand factor type A (vWA) domain
MTPDHDDLIARLWQQENEPIHDWEDWANRASTLFNEAASALALITAERDEAREARDRAERNRDMWKGQCERQAQFSSALAEVEAARPGSFWALSKGRVSEAEPLYGFHILFGTDEVLASGEGDSIEDAIRVARKALANGEGGNG